MRSLSRTVAILLTALTLGTGGLAVAGCGAAGHALGGAAVHSVLNHLTKGHPGLQRAINKGFCLYHGHRIVVDVRNGHYISAGLNGYLAYKACKHGFFH